MKGTPVLCDLPSFESFLSDDFVNILYVIYDRCG